MTVRYVDGEVTSHTPMTLRYVGGECISHSSMTVRYVCGESTSLLFGFVTDLMHIATFHRPTVRKLRNPKSHLDSVSSQVEHWNKL